MKYFIKARRTDWIEVDKEKFIKYTNFLKRTFAEVGANTEEKRKEYLERYTKIVRDKE